MQTVETKPGQGNARLRVLVATATFGTIGVFTKNIPLPSAELAACRAVIAAVFLFALILLQKRAAAFSQAQGRLKLLFFSGLAIGVNWILLFEAFRHTSVAIATLSYYFAPTLVVLASALLFREKPGLRQTLCFFGSTAGLVLIINVSGGTSAGFTGVLYGLGAALLYAVVVLLNKATGEVDALIRSCIQFASASVVLLPYVLLTSGFHFTTLTGTELLSVAVVGVVHTGVMFYLYFSGLSMLLGQQAAILSYVDPLVAVLLSVLWLKEPISGLQVVGGGMILVFTLLSELRLKGKKKSEAFGEKL